MLLAERVLKGKGFERFARWFGRGACMAWPLAKWPRGGDALADVPVSVAGVLDVTL